MATSKPARARTARKQKLTISIVDDDESVREAVEGLMHWLGYKVRTYLSAVEFLAAPGVAGNACIIADVQMPQISGIEMHKFLKAQGHNVPTILITAYPNEQARASALADGVVCYLSKPFDKDILIECVRTALQSRSE